MSAESKTTRQFHNGKNYLACGGISKNPLNQKHFYVVKEFAPAGVELEQTKMVQLPKCDFDSCIFLNVSL